MDRETVSKNCKIAFKILKFTKKYKCIEIRKSKIFRKTMHFSVYIEESKNIYSENFKLLNYNVMVNQKLSSV